MVNQSQVRQTTPGVDIIGFSPGFWIGGVRVNNPSDSWLNIQAGLQGTLWVPPLTLGWSEPFIVALQSVSLVFVTAPYSAPSSSNTGALVEITVYEKGITVPPFPGRAITSTVASTLILFPTAIISSAVANTITTGGVLPAPGAALRYRIWSIFVALLTTTDAVTRWRLALLDSVSGLVFALTSGADFDMAPPLIYPGGLTLNYNAAITWSVQSAVASIHINVYVFYSLER